MKNCIQTRELRGINIIGSWGGEPIGKRAPVQGWPFALVHAFAANTHQVAKRSWFSEVGFNQLGSRPAFFILRWTASLFNQDSLTS